MINLVEQGIPPEVVASLVHSIRTEADKNKPSSQK